MSNGKTNEHSLEKQTDLEKIFSEFEGVLNPEHAKSDWEDVKPVGREVF